jgi:ComF family protein
MTLFSYLLSLIFPTSCLGCNTKSVLLCRRCFYTISLLESQECPGCRCTRQYGEFCPRCSKLGGWYFDSLIVCSKYDKSGLLQKIIKTFKYKFSKELAVYLGDLLIRCVDRPESRSERSELYTFFEQLFNEGALVVPVPLHKKRLKDRGFNQAKILAEFLGRPVRELLFRKINTPHQARCSRQERLKNLNNAFCVRPGVESVSKVILVDDVCSTGSTLNECAKVLKEAGVSYIACIVLARGDGR